MECFCGCGTRLSRRQTALNMQAAEIAVELLAWDKARVAGYLDSSLGEDLELIERGAERYRRLLMALHGKEGVYELEEGEGWLKESIASRMKRSYMTKSGAFMRRAELILTDADRDRLDRLHPESSFSGTGGEAHGDGSAASQLERLEALHREGVLTETEFDAARERISGR